MSDHDHQEKPYSIISELDHNKNPAVNMILEHHSKQIDLVPE